MQAEENREDDFECLEVECVSRIIISEMDVDGDGDIDDVYSIVDDTTVLQKNKRSGIGKATLHNTGTKKTPAGIRYSYSADEYIKESRLLEMSLEERINKAKKMAAEQNVEKSCVEKEERELDDR